MLISRRHNFIFIHIYKNAGTSIRSALKPFSATPWMRLADRAAKKLKISLPNTPEPFHGHITASKVISIIGREEFDRYFSFAIVRNPWDWQVSLYKYMLGNPKHHQHSIIKDLGSFDAYILWRCEEQRFYQKDFIYSENGELLVNFVGRFEYIQEDFKTICDRIGISTSLPMRNVSNTESYKNFYTDETIELVRRAYEPDIKLFGYDF